jgi:prolyl-tRNA synthetase
VEVLLDDTEDRPGVKFATADLIGIPHRITVGDRALKEGNVEYLLRGEISDERGGRDATPVPVDAILDHIDGSESNNKNRP